MRFEDLKRYTPSIIPGDKGRGLLARLEPSEDGEAVLVKDLPQKIPVDQELPDPKRCETVIMYFEDDTHTFGLWMGTYWNVMCFGQVEEKVVAWRRIMT